MEDNIVHFDKDTPKIAQANKVKSLLAVNGDDDTIGSVEFDLLVLEAGKNVGDAVKINGLVLPALGTVNKKTTVRGGATGKTFTYTDPVTSQVTTIVIGVNMVADLFWDGELKTWSKIDEDSLPTSEPTGLIKENDPNATAGGTVFKLLDKVLRFSSAIPFILYAGEISASTGVPNTSANWLRTGRIPYDSELGQVSIEGYGHYNSAGAERVNNYRVACFNGTALLGFSPSPLNSSKFTFTPIVNTDNFMIQVEAGTNVGSDPSNSPFNQSLKVYYGTELIDDDLRAEKIRGNITTPQILSIEQKVALIDDVIEVAFERPPITTTSGKLRANGTADSTTTYRRTSVTSSSSMAHYDSTRRYYYSGEITAVGDVAAVAYVNASSVIIGVEIFPVGVYVRRELAPPIGTSYIAACSYLVDPIIEFATPILKSEASTTFYVNGSTGNDNNKGDSSTPFLTINRAILELAKRSKGTIIVSRGDYRETLNLTLLGTGDFKILNRDGHTVRILGSNKLIEWSKTDGYSNIYEVPYAGSIPNWSRNANPIFEDGNPSKPVDVKDYHPLQKNLTHRLPFTPILAVGSLAEVESTPASYFATGGKIYVHTSNSDDPSTNGFSYEVIARSANLGNNASTTTKKVDITLKGLQFLYTLSGVVSIGFSKVKYIDVVSLATPSAGAFRCDTGLNFFFGCEAGYCNGDGFNGHFSSYSGYATLIDNRANYPTTKYENCWSHDNFDDGESSHEHHNVIMNNFLSEFNGDSGSRPSNDATYYVTNSIFRHNGWEVGHGGSAGKGEGFAVVNPSSGGSRIGCRAILIGCLSYGNNTGYGTISSNTNVIELINCIARNNFTAEYYVGVGTMILRNCLGSNESPAKIKVIGAGVMEVFNDNLVA